MERKATLREALALIDDDISFHCKSQNVLSRLFALLLNPSLQLVILCRLNHLFCRSEFLTAFLRYLQAILFGCYIHPFAFLGRRIKFAHPTSIVIGENASVGNNVVIYQCVTLGSHGKADGGERTYPLVEDDVTIFANAVLIGGVKIGRGSIVGAGSVVLKDVPAYAVVAGVPAKVIRQSS